MKSPTYTMADAIRAVAISVEKAIDDGHRSNHVDASDLIEILLAIADRLDPPLATDTNPVACPCPECGQDDPDHLVWQDESTVRCDRCGTIYIPE